MKLADVIAAVKNADKENEKTASAKAAPAVKTAAPVADPLSAALNSALAAASTSDKTASASTPVADLEKIASQVVDAEQEALVKEARLYGAAVADGFVARIAQHNAAAEKVAAARPEVNDSFDKFASENPDLVKEAADLGYQTTMAQIQKLAQASYNKGYEETTNQIYKTACDAFSLGYNATMELLKA